jgi:transposase, IS6 family
MQRLLNASRLKALCSFAHSAPHAGTIEEKVPQLALPANGNSSGQAPRVINVEKNAAYPKAIAELKSSTILPASVELTPASNTETTSLSKITVRIKRLVKPGMGFFSFETAGKTVQG